MALDVELTPEQVQLGLTVPAAASVLMGEIGAIMVLVMLFMAVTSAGSAELIAVSSLLTYDIYRTYKNPNATGKQLLKVSKPPPLTLNLKAFFSCSSSCSRFAASVAVISCCSMSSVTRDMCLSNSFQSYFLF